MTVAIYDWLLRLFVRMGPRGRCRFAEGVNLFTLAMTSWQAYANIRDGRPGAACVSGFMAGFTLFFLLVLRFVARPAVLETPGWRQLHKRYAAHLARTYPE